MSNTFRFRMTRADWVALSTAVARRPWHFRLVTLIASLSAMVFVMAWIRSDTDPNRSMLSEIVAGDQKWWPMLGFFVLFAIGMMNRHRLSGLSARVGFSSMPIADKELEVTLGKDDVHVVAVDGSGFDWRFTWNDVGRLIETPERLILAVGPRQGLPIPRAAFAKEADFAKIEKLLRARLPQGVAHERA